MKLITRIKECKMHSLMYILGTALAVSYVMLVVIPIYLCVTPIYPENNRPGTYTISDIRVNYSGNTHYQSMSPQLWYEMLSRVKSVDNIAMVSWTEGVRVITTDGKRDKDFLARRISPNAFKVYELDFVEGRPFTWDEHEKGEAGIIITDKAAEKLFGDEEHVVGRTVTIGAETKAIQGVVKNPTRYASTTCADIYLPMPNLADIQLADSALNRLYAEDGKPPVGMFTRVLGFNGNRYKAQFIGTAEQAEAVGRELDALMSQFISRTKAAGEEGEASFVSHPLSAFGAMWGTNDVLVKRLAIYLLIIFLLLIPVMSLVSLVNWRMTGRIPEMAVRRAFGATRRTLLKEILWENLQLTCIGGLLGLLIAWCYVPNAEWLMRVIDAGIEHSQGLYSSDNLPLANYLSPWIFLATFLFCVVINLSAALLPVWRMLRKTYRGVQAAEGCRHTMFVPGPFRPKELWHSRMQLVKVFIIALTSWLMLTMSLMPLVERYWPGKFNTEHYVAMDFDADASLYSTVDSVTGANYQVVVEEARRLPDVEEATIVLSKYNMPGVMTGDIKFTADTISNTLYKGNQGYYICNTRFFETLGLKPVEGSPSIKEMEAAQADNPCIISRSAAIHAFGTTDAVGRVLWEMDFRGQTAERSYHVVGVVEDVAMNMNNRIKDMVYTTLDGGANLLLRLKPDCNETQFCERYNRQERANRIKSNVWVATNAQPLKEVQEQWGTHNYNMQENIANTGLLFLLLNLLLDMVGTFWIRTRGIRGYIGVMRAFGASRRRIVMGLLAEGWLIVVIAFTLATAFVIYQTGGEDLCSAITLSTAGCTPTDWLDIPAMQFLLCGTSILAILLITATIGIVIPAWMATKEQLIESLKDE